MKRIGIIAIGITLFFTSGVFAQDGTFPTFMVAIYSPTSLDMVDGTIRVTGVERGSFEGNVVIHVLDSGGNLLVEMPTTASGALGGYAVWALDVPVNATSGDLLTINAFFQSPRDGSIIAEDSVYVFYQQRPTDTAQISIVSPHHYDTTQDQHLVVSGLAVTPPDWFVVLHVLDESGALIGEHNTPITAQSETLNAWLIEINLPPFTELATYTLIAYASNTDSIAAPVTMPFRDRVRIAVAPSGGLSN